MTRRSRSEWTAIIHRWRVSGLTAREFAEREGLNPATLRWWNSQVPQESPPASFVEVHLPSPAPAGLTVVLPDGLRIEVTNTVDTDLLRRVVAALESR